MNKLVVQRQEPMVQTVPRTVAVHRRVSEAESFDDAGRANRQSQEVQESPQLIFYVSRTVQRRKAQIEIRRVGEGSWRATSSAGSRGDRHLDPRARGAQRNPWCAGELITIALFRSVLVQFDV